MLRQLKNRIKRVTVFDETSNEMSNAQVREMTTPEQFRKFKTLMRKAQFIQAITGHDELIIYAPRKYDPEIDPSILVYAVSSDIEEFDSARKAVELLKKSSLVKLLDDSTKDNINVYYSEPE